MEDMDHELIVAHSDVVMPAIPFLQRVEASTRERLLSIGTVVQYTSGERLIGFGEPGDSVMLILGGAGKIVTEDELGMTVILDLAVAGDILGEAAVVDPEHGRMASVIAINEVTVRRIGAADFCDFIRADGSSAYELLITIVRRNRIAQGQRTAARSNMTPAYVARRLDYLLELIGEPTHRGWELSAALTREEHAQFVPMGRTRLIETFSALAEMGILSLSRRAVTVVDRPLLREVAEGTVVVHMGRPSST